MPLTIRRHLGVSPDAGHSQLECWEMGLGLGVELWLLQSLASAWQALAFPELKVFRPSPPAPP